jgi:HK97 family phage prohead protease
MSRTVTKTASRPSLRVTATAPTLSRVTLLDGLVTAADPGGRTITGLVVQWGVTGRTSIGPCRFARGSIAAADPRRVKLMVEHDVAQVVGYLTAAQETDQGLVGTFTVPPGPAGDAVLASAAAGLRDGLSVGVEVTAASPGADGVLEVSAGDWRETSVVAIPAFAGSTVTQVAASAPGGVFTAAAALTPAGAGVTPQAPAPAAPLVAATYVPAGAPWQARAAAPLKFDEAVQRITAGWRSGGAEGALRAALSDVVPPTDATQRDALFRPQWLGELWQTSYTQRDLIDCISHGVLTSFTVTGFRINKPAFGVDVYTGNKTPVPSPGTFGVTPVTENAQRIAGAHDIDRAFMDLGDGSFVNSYFRYQAENYAVLTEATVATRLLAEATPLIEAPADILEALDVLARAFALLGGNARMSFVAISADVWSTLLGIPAADAPWLYGGNASLVGSTAEVGGIRLFAESSLPANTVLAGDRRAATFYEWRNPPLGIQAVNVANGGIDLGVFGYCATIVNNPDALLKCSLATAPLVTDRASSGKGSK